MEGEMEPFTASTATQVRETPMLNTCLACGYNTFAHYIDCPKCQKNRWERKRLYNPY